jgi:ParB-like chromosome segregation protein Spo0J
MANLDFEPAKILKVDINSVKPNEYNPKKADTSEYHKIVKSIQTNGLRGIILVRELEKDSYEIIDGAQRYTAAKELGFTEINIYNEGKVDDKRARELTIWYQQQVPFDRVEEAYLVNKLLIEYPGQVLLPYTETELEELQEIANFDFDNYDSSGKVAGDGVTIVFHFGKDDGDRVMQHLLAIDESKETALLELINEN